MKRFLLLLTFILLVLATGRPALAEVGAVAADKGESAGASSAVETPAPMATPQPPENDEKAAAPAETGQPPIEKEPPKKNGEQRRPYFPPWVKIPKLPQAPTGGPWPEWKAEFRFGYFIPRNTLVYRTFGDDNEIYQLRAGYNLFKNGHLVVGAGLLYEEGVAQSLDNAGNYVDTNYKEKLFLVPLELDLEYDLRFSRDQWIIPALGFGFDWVYFHDEVSTADGRSVTPSVSGGLLGYHIEAGLDFNLGALERDAARKFADKYGVLGVYLSGRARYQVVNDLSTHGLDLSGGVFTGGLVFEF